MAVKIKQIKTLSKMLSLVDVRVDLVERLRILQSLHIGVFSHQIYF